MQLFANKFGAVEHMTNKWNGIETPINHWITVEEIKGLGLTYGSHNHSVFVFLWNEDLQKIEDGTICR